MSEIVKWVAEVAVLALIGWALQMAERRAKDWREFVRIRTLVVLAPVCASGHHSRCVRGNRWTLTPRDANDDTMASY